MINENEIIYFYFVQRNYLFLKEISITWPLIFGCYEDLFHKFHWFNEIYTDEIFHASSKVHVIVWIALTSVKPKKCPTKRFIRINITYDLKYPCRKLLIINHQSSRLSIFTQFLMIIVRERLSKFFVWRLPLNGGAVDFENI